MRRHVVGVLGGMGPEATILLQQRLLSLVDAKDDEDHLPLLIDMNPQVPSRINHLIEKRGENPGPVLAAMARRLQEAGSTAIAMPCNTAHHYAPFITEATTIPFIDMVTQSAHAARQTLWEKAKVGILASPASKIAAVFDAPFKNVGLSIIWPEDGDRMLAAIKTTKANGPTPRALAILTDAANEMIRNGADLLLIACSEFSLMTPNLKMDVPVIDTIDVLAAEIRDHSTRKMS